MLRCFLLGAAVVALGSFWLPDNRRAPDLPVDDPVPNEAPIRKRQPKLRRWDAIEAMHRWHADDFISNSGFGLRRMQPMQLSMVLHLQGADYVIRRRRLIGDSIHEEPRLYEEVNDSHMAAEKPAKWALLDETDAAALRTLRLGEDTSIAIGRRRLLGALRAQRSCLKCHEVEEGALLGAIRYDLTPIATEPRPVLRQATNR